MIKVIQSVRGALFSCQSIVRNRICESDFSPTVLSVRFRYSKIRGGGRPLPEGMLPPLPCKYRFKVQFPEDGKYTTTPLPLHKLGGRDPETGRVVVRTIGGGHKKRYRWVLHDRQPNEDGSVKEEKVFQVRYDPVRTCRIALVASSELKRWIVATENMKPGDIIRTSGDIPSLPVEPKEGDAHPLGALPVGTIINNIEQFPGQGGNYCHSGAAFATLLRKIDGRCIVQLPSKLQVSLDEKCMAVVGKVSLQSRRPIGPFQRFRWLGQRPRSGLWHRKDGYCGRKIKPPPPLLVLLKPKVPKPEPYQLI